jgi:protein-S-isoprenylcysteine O-methyltransferase Ste14
LIDAMNTRLLARYAFTQVSALVGMGVALFWAAGRVDWWPAWAALAVMTAWTTAMTLVIVRLNPGLLAERLGPRQGTKKWDTAIVSVLGLTQLVRYIVAGLDQRYGWSGDIPVAAQVTALILCTLGYALFVLAAASNTFFSQLIRIQAERGHTVATGGPYRIVRHPAYLGAMVYELAVPFLLGSWWALPVSLMSAALITLRTTLEDRTLQAELTGYADYARHVRYRLLPGVW